MKEIIEVISSYKYNFQSLQFEKLPISNSYHKKVIFKENFSPELKVNVYLYLVAAASTILRTVSDISGLLVRQLKGKDLGEELLIPSVMLRDGGDMFLDSITLEELSEDLGVKITPTDNDGYELLSRILGEEQ